MVTPAHIRRSGTAVLAGAAPRAEMVCPLKAVSSPGTHASCTLHPRFPKDYATGNEQGQGRCSALHGGARTTRVCFMSNIRLCRDSDREAILAIINAAALAYRGVIPADRWHEPYMAADELDN